MTLKNPSPLFRAMVLAAQGVFYNAFCESFPDLIRVALLMAVCLSCSPLLYHLTKHLPSICRSPRRRGRGDIVSVRARIQA